MSSPSEIQAILSAFSAFTECLRHHPDNIGTCQEAYTTLHSALGDNELHFEKFTKPARKFWEKKCEEEDDDEDCPHVSLEKTELSNTLTDVLPQVFDGDAKREKTFLSKTLERLMPRFFTEAEGDDEDEDD